MKGLKWYHYLVIGLTALILCGCVLATGITAGFFGGRVSVSSRAQTPTEQAVQPAPIAAPTATPMPTWQPTPLPPKTYPLAGQTYQAWIEGTPDKTGLYEATWTSEGWLWQPKLPPEGQRSGFVMSITIAEGQYVFNGVSCRLHLDPQRNGRGAENPRTVAYGNGLPFEVRTTDHGEAWAFVVCDQTDVTGFSIRYIGP